MKRIGLALAGAALLAALAAVVVPWATPDDAIRGAVARQVEALTGRTPIISGPVRFALLPLPSLSVEGLSVPGSGTSGPLLEAPAVTAGLSIPALLLGRFDVREIDLSAARLRLVRLEDGGRSFALRDGFLGKLAAGADESVPIGVVRMTGGSILLNDETTGRSGEVVVREVRLRWPSPTDRLTIAGDVEWRGREVEIAFSLSDPVALLNAGASDLTFKASSDSLRASMTGSVSAAASRFEGDVRMSSPELRDALEWGGLVVERGGGLQTFDVSSDAIIDDNGISLQTAQVEIDGNRAEGALLVHLGGERPKISGTLAADTLDLSAYLGGFEFPGSAPHSGEDPISLDALALADLDIRFSSAETVIGSSRIGRTAAAAVTHDGLLEVSIGEAAAFGGTVKGRMTFAPVGHKVRVGALVDFEDMEMSAALSEAFGFSRLEGAGRGRIEVSGIGRTMTELTSTLGGEASFTVENGALVGFDIASFLKRMEERPVMLRTEGRSGRTAFQKASASFAVAAGVAVTRNARLEGDELVVDLGGEASVARRTLDLAGEASLSGGADNADEAASAPRFPFTIKGSWAEPTVVPNARALVPGAGSDELRGTKALPPVSGIASP